MAGLIGFIILLYVSFLVFKDAKSRGMNAQGWSVFVFLLLIVGLPAYFIFRKPKDPAYGENEDEK